MNRNNRWYLPIVVGLIILTLTIIRFTSPDENVVTDPLAGPITIEEQLGHDPGLLTAWQNDFAQQIDAVDEHDGVRFHVQQMIADELRMAILYTLESTIEGRPFAITDLKMTDENGNSLRASYSYGDPKHTTDERVQDMVDITFAEGAGLPHQITLTFTAALSGTDQLPLPPNGATKTYSVTFPVKQEQFKGKKRDYPINQSVTLAGQSITVKRITMYPTKTAVEMMYDPQNTHKIFGIDNLRIVSESGKEWKSTDGLTISQLAEDHVIYYLDSAYFSASEPFRLVADSIRAVPKDQLDVVLDIRSQKLLKTPDDSISLERFETGEDTATIEFAVNEDDRNAPGNPTAHLFFSSFTDNLGKQFESAEHFYRNGEKQARVGFTLEDYTYAPNRTMLTLRLSDYPARLDGEFSIPLQ
ncbi:DUF4179 domain-containing protein [Brevibacillus migulae]|uniref:DUF4179 domain-containing protein n=1 Tax=Brevibacillus migulae TaxID=1644114 RepID=UPI00142FB81D|nr:DUF4179 domain-containing protein [Brevibacillus migulae]